MKKNLIIAVMVIMVFACNTSTPTAASTIDIMRAAGETMTVEAALSTPTSTPQPTSTEPPLPTSTPLPTDTPAPTFTPTDTYTPTPPPEPIAYSGMGDTILDIEIPDVPGVLQIIGLATSGHFAIISYNANGEYIDLLVNTTGLYNGVRPVNTDGQIATRLEIKSGGPWTVAWMPLSDQYVSFVNVPGVLSGTGDDVVLLLGGTADTISVVGNSVSQHFAILSYDAYGKILDLLVNTTDPYQGTVLVDPNAAFLEIISEGEWTIDVSEK